MKFTRPWDRFFSLILIGCVGILHSACTWMGSDRHFISAYESEHGELPPSSQTQASVRPTTPQTKDSPCFVVIDVPEQEIIHRKQVLVRPAQLTTNLYPGVEQWEDKQVLVQEEKSTLTIVPAVFDWVDDPAAEGGKRKVVITPAYTERRVEPAVYKTERVPRPPGPGEFHVKEQPPEYKTIETPEQIPARTERVEILCEALQTPETVRTIQRALKREGYTPGEYDGRVGNRTLKALEAFVRDRNLPDVPWSMETLRALGVPPSPAGSN